MMREEELLAKRFVDLSRQAYNKGITTFSDFLNLNEQNIFHSCKSEIYTEFRLFGGYEGAERQMIAFLPDALVFRGEYPFVCCKIEPLNHKFADELSHRDVLGSLMNLGIDRSKLGDILVKDNLIYVFCHKSISSFIIEELTRIRHTSVSVCLTELEQNDIKPNLELCQSIVSSNRLDSLVAAMCKISRSQSADLIKSGRVFINGKETVSSSYTCKPEEIISIRGFGRFRFKQDTGETRKGRVKIQYEKYI